jgi:hypothetical protein
LQRGEVAHTLPFFLRAWWLRDRLGNEEMAFGGGNGSTLPLRSAHTDPICDVANADSVVL